MTSPRRRSWAPFPPGWVPAWAIPGAYFCPGPHPCRRTVSPGCDGLATVSQPWAWPKGTRNEEAGLGPGAKPAPVALCCGAFGGCSRGSSLLVGAPFPPLNHRLSSSLRVVIGKELGQGWHRQQHWPGPKTTSLRVFILNVCFDGLEASLPWKILKVRTSVVSITRHIMRTEVVSPGGVQWRELPRLTPRNLKIQQPLIQPSG